MMRRFIDEQRSQHALRPGEKGAETIGQIGRNFSPMRRIGEEVGQAVPSLLDFVACHSSVQRSKLEDPHGRPP